MKLCAFQTKGGRENRRRTLCGHFRSVENWGLILFPGLIFDYVVIMGSKAAILL